MAVVRIARRAVAVAVAVVIPLAEAADIRVEAATAKIEGCCC